MEATVQADIIVVFREESGWDGVGTLIVWDRPLISVDNFELRAMGYDQTSLSSEGTES